ncbi:MAG TPA: patatin-like phospholipase family protein [Solirubrobacteraceae bacterium]|nr:patatin-like phospholipase family protein [Solirubrobacteraceae bacterium]
MRLSALRPFVADPMLSTAAPAADLRAHPVLQAILRRRDSGSAPGARRDGLRIALAIEGGGMRGVVSAGMAAAIEQLGLTDCFDEVHGASAGAFNAAFLLAGQAAYLTALYAHGFGDPVFAGLRRVLRGGPPFDLDYVIGEVWRHRRPLRTDRILASGIELHCTATDVDRARLVDLTALSSDREIRCALRASARLPWLAGPPVGFRGMRLLDATLAEAIPVSVPLRQATHVLVLQTRPHGVRHRPLSGPVARLTDRYLRSFNPQLVALRRTRSERYDALAAQLSARSADPSAAPAVCVIRPPAGSRSIGQMENRLAALQAAGAVGMRAAWTAFTGSDPELIGAPRAYPRHEPPAEAESASAVAATGEARPRTVKIL